MASVLGVAHHSTFEASAAMRLEALARSAPARSVTAIPARWIGAPMVLDTPALIAALVDQLRSGRDVAELAAVFHESLAAAVAAACEQLAATTGVSRVALSGGVFQNVLLLARTSALLRERGLTRLHQPRGARQRRRRQPGPGVRRRVAGCREHPGLGMMDLMDGTGLASGTDLSFLRDGVAARCAAGEAYFAAAAQELALCAAAMADRFFAGATLLVFGSGAGATDAQHNSVEYVHPVLPGCRALPALSLTNDVSTVTSILNGSDPLEVYAHQLRILGRPGDIALAFLTSAGDGASLRGLRTAAGGGMLTIALSTGARVPSAASHTFHVDSDDSLVAQELHLATYHMLWELTHIVLNHRGIAEARP